MHAAALTMVERMKASGMILWTCSWSRTCWMWGSRAALPPELRGVPIALYFHENQLTFPIIGAASGGRTGITHFWLTSALLADVVWFNSSTTAGCSWMPYRIFCGSCLLPVGAT